MTKALHLLHVKTSFLLSWGLLLLIGVSAPRTFAQTVITTTHANNNGNSTVTLNFQNTNAYDVIITDLGSVCSATTGTTMTAQLWYKTTPIAGAPGAISVANGWTQHGAAQTFSSIQNTTTSTAQPMMTGLSLIVPAGQTYGLAFGLNASLRYSTLAAGTYTFTGGGCNIINGTSISYGGTPIPAAPTFTPCGFIGTIGFIPAVPCTAGQVANVASSANPACPNANFVLSLTGISLGTGMTYQWQSSPNNSTWSNMPSGTNSTMTTNQLSATYYRCEVTCAGTTTASNSLYVTMNNFMNCYCVSGATSAADDDIGEVTFGSMTNTSPGFTPTTLINNAAANATYTSYVALPPASYNQGVSYPISIWQFNQFGSYNNYVEAYIDYNQDGIFDPVAELVFGSNISGVTTNPTYPDPATGNILIPLTSTPGQTVMRIVLRESGTAASVVPCGTYTWGETEDYRINIVAALPCTNPPTPGVAGASLNPVCPNQPFALNLTGNSIGLGQTYQWQSSPDAITWTPIAGATNTFYTMATGQTVNTYYRCEVICSGGTAVYSTNYYVTMNPFSSCYCTSNATSVADEEILNVMFGSLNNSSTCAGPAVGTGSILNQYSNYTALVAAPIVSQLDVVPFSVQVGTCGGNFSNCTAIFIDYNQNGLFTDLGEKVYVSAAATVGAHTEIGTVTIPLAATPGVTRMRVVTVETTVPGSIVPCGTYNWGETEDYNVEIIATVPCTNPINAGTTTSSMNPICPSTTFTLGITGYSTGSGQTYQWQSSPDNITWTPIATATSPFYTVTGGITVPMYYRCEIQCLGGTLAYSPVLNETLNSFLSCYCASGATTTFDEEIYSVTVNGASTNPLYAGAAGCTTPAPGPGSTLGQYSNFKTLGNLTSVMQGATIPFTIEENECDGATFYAFGSAIWIDYNQNGVFTDPGEKVFVEAATLVGPRNVVGSFTIPITATPGVTAMRVIAAEGFSGAALTPCLSYGYGETEDFLIEIQAAPLCANPPTPGVTVATPNPVCASTTFGLSLTGAITAVLGQTYQWQSSPDNITWTPIAGATGTTHTVTGGITAPTWYRCEFICSAGTPAYSTPVQVTLNSFLSCYCTSTATINADEEIFNVTFGALNNTSACGTLAPGPGSVAGMYSNYKTLPVVNYTQGAIVPLSIQIGTCGGNFTNSIAVFIDYNQNGLLTDPGEKVYVSAAGTAGAHTETGSVTIPVAATIGNTLMRVVNVETATPGSILPCGTYFYGETEDYLINISAPILWDGAISGLVVPTNPCALSASNTVTGVFTNGGVNTIDASTGALVVLTLTGANTGSYTWTNTATLLTNQTTPVSFTGVNVSNPGLTTFTATVVLTGDGYAGNNVATGTYTGQAAISTFPYSEGFETSNGGWTPGGANSSWAWGTPAGAVINSAAGGTKAWVTNLTGNYNSSEESYLQSPCLDFSALAPGCDPVISFSQINNTEAGWDGFWVEYSTNGSTWTTLGVISASGPGIANWYNYNGNFFVFPTAQNAWNGNSGTPPAWMTSSHPLTGLAGMSGVRVRIHFHSDNSVEYEGVGIDNVSIFVPSVDVGVSAITPISSGCSLPNNQAVTVTIQNNGCSAASNIPVTVTGGVPASISGVFAGPIASGASATFTLPTTLDLSSDGTYTLLATTTMAGDVNTANDASPTVIVKNFASAATPTAANATICSGNTAALVASIPATAQGEFFWYDAPVAGTLLTVNDTFTTPVLTSPSVSSTTNYWVEVNSGLKITEITQFNTGTGASVYPSWLTISGGDDDFVEITNLGPTTLDVAGYSLQMFGAMNSTYTLPTGTPILMDPGEVMVIHLGPGVNVIANNYYHHAGVANNTLSSASAVGYVLKNGATILDAVATNSYTFLAASGVTPQMWSGNTPGTTGRAGLIRNYNDKNNNTDWVLSNAPTPLQTIGSLNPNLQVSCTGMRTQVTVTVNPCCTGGPLVTKIPDVTGTYDANAYCVDGNFIHYMYDDPGAGTDYLLLSLDLASNPAALGAFNSTWGMGGYNVRVVVDGKYMLPATAGNSTHVTQATTGQSTYPQATDWYIMNRSWQVGINATGIQIPLGNTVKVRNYYTDHDFGQVSADAPGVTTEPELIFFKLATGFDPNPALAHAGVSGTDITLYTNTTTPPAAVGSWYLNQAPFPTSLATENYAEFLVSSFSGGGGGACNNCLPLPVEMDFSGYSLEGKNYLDWTTFKEVNNAYFDVESSVDGISFTKIGLVNSLADGGNSTQPLDYGFIDETPSSNVMYYRLKQVDINNESHYSNVVEIRLSNDRFQVGEVFPNPATNAFNLAISSPSAHDFIIEVYDAIGKNIKTQSLETAGGTEVWSMDISTLAVGTYNVVVRSKTEDFTVSRRFVKANP